MKADDNTMNPFELAIFHQVEALFEQREVFRTSGLRPIVVKSNGAFAALTLACPSRDDEKRFDNLISEAVNPLGVTKITFRLVPIQTVETEKPKEATPAGPDPLLDPFADFSFSRDGR